MHIPDLSTNCYGASGDDLRSVGWLETGKEFPIAAPTFAVITALNQQLAEPFQLWYFMGGHHCSLCPPTERPYATGELFVPAATRCYVAPVMIGHYVSVHKYRPPTEFIDALLQCPPQGSAEFQLLIAPFLPALSKLA